MRKYVFLTIAALSVSTAMTAVVFAREFGGYECTDDCSGHKAGYEWAESKGITLESQCDAILRRNPRRTSFYEGCLAYVEDPERGADEDDDGDEID